MNNTLQPRKTNNEIQRSTMKNHAKRFGLWAALLGISTASASAVLVTYQVDMSIQMALGNFNPGSGDTLEVAGTMTSSAWTVFTTLTVSPTNSNLYDVTINDVETAGNYENHKFIIDVGGTGATRNWESIGNRFYQVPATATNLPTVFFNDVSTVNNILTENVTFNVNMGVQITLGNFNPSSDFVYVAGDVVNNWQPGLTLSPSVADTNIYTVTVPVTNSVGATVNYKFIMNTFAQGTTWESDGVGPGGAQNRQFIFPNTATNLQVYYFNNLSNAASLVIEPVTFTLNTAVQHALGNFDPSSGSISVAGDVINNWSPTACELTQNPSNPDLWSGTFNVTNSIGSPVNFKFVLNNGATWEAGVGPNGADNRLLVFTNAPTTLSSVFFNNIGTLGTVSITNITGKVLTLSWVGGPNIRLQTAGTPGAWLDVPNTAGLSTTTVTNDASAKYLRLIGP
jgi:hypothetical protein